MSIPKFPAVSSLPVLLASGDADDSGELVVLGRRTDPTPKTPSPLDATSAPFVRVPPERNIELAKPEQPSATSQEAIERATALFKAAGSKGERLEVVRALATNGELTRSLLYFQRGESASAREQSLQRSRLHYVINTDGPVGPPAPWALRTFAEALENVNAYARSLGYRDVVANQGTLVVRSNDGGQQLLGRVPNPAKTSPDAALRELGRKLNELRFGSPRIVPPSGPVKPSLRLQEPSFSRSEALWSSHLSSLAYESRETVEAQLRAWNFDLSTFTWLDHGPSDTQGFVVSDKAGNTFVSFRGSSSMTDMATNAWMGLVQPTWAGPVANAKVHSGFNDAVSGIWPQLTAALARATTKSRAKSARRGLLPGSVFFTGHSLGGALAQVAAMRAHVEQRVPTSAAVYSFGSPRIGNDALREVYNDFVPASFRVVTVDDDDGDTDAITSAPPKWMGYRHAGSLVRLHSLELEVLSVAQLRAQAALWDGEARAEGEDAFGTDVGDPNVERLRGLELARYMRQLEALVASQKAGDWRGEKAIPGAPENSSLHRLRLYLERLGNQEFLGGH